MGKALPEVKTAWGVSQVIFPDSYQEKAEGAKGGFVCPALTVFPPTHQSPRSLHIHGCFSWIWFPVLQSDG